MTRLAATTVLLAACAMPTERSAELGARSEPVLYGADDRVDLQDASDPSLADGLAALVPAERLTIDGDRVATAPTTLAEILGGPLCAGERFESTSSLATCSAALVTRDAVLTAAHCVPDDAACADLRIVFGFHREGDTLAPIAATDVFRCVAREDERPSQDRVRLRLDHPTERRPFERARAAAGDLVLLAGHPAGGPALVEEGLVVDRREGEGIVLYADVEDGSSGSPVVAASGALVGILAAGETDYEWTGSCYASRRLAPGEGEGAWAADPVTADGCSAAGAAPRLSSLLLLLLAIGRVPRRSRRRGASAGCGPRRGNGASARPGRGRCRS